MSTENYDANRQKEIVDICLKKFVENYSAGPLELVKPAIRLFKEKYVKADRQR